MSAEGDDNKAEPSESNGDDDEGNVAGEGSDNESGNAAGALVRAWGGDGLKGAFRPHFEAYFGM
jgi:hypothetical protein